MSVDWFTLVAQLLNFVLLLVLLRVFLYKPVLAAMDERAALTTAALTEARERSEAAAAELSALTAQRVALESEHAEALGAMARAIEAERQRRLAEVEQETAAARRARATALESELDGVTDRLRGGLADLVVDEVRASLTLLAGEEAGADLGDRAVATFAARLRSLSAERLEQLRTAAAISAASRTTPSPVAGGPTGAAATLRVAQPLGDGAASELRAVIRELLGIDEVRVEVDPSVVLGAVLDVGGLRVDGSAAARLEALEAAFKEALA